MFVRSLLVQSRSGSVGTGGRPGAICCQTVIADVPGAGMSTGGAGMPWAVMPWSKPPGPGCCGGLFEYVLARAVDRGLVHDGVDIETVAEVFPAIAYQRVAARGLVLVDEDVVRVVNGVLLPALGVPQPTTGPAHATA